MRFGLTDVLGTLPAFWLGLRFFTVSSATTSMRQARASDRQDMSLHYREMAMRTSNDNLMASISAYSPDASAIGHAVQRVQAGLERR